MGLAHAIIGLEDAIVSLESAGITLGSASSGFAPPIRTLAGAIVGQAIEMLCLEIGVDSAEHAIMGLADATRRSGGAARRGPGAFMRLANRTAPLANAINDSANAIDGLGRRTSRLPSAIRRS